MTSGPGGASSSLRNACTFDDHESFVEIVRVHQARRVSLNRIVALEKILNRKFAAEADHRPFRRETETVANLETSS